MAAEKDPSIFSDRGTIGSSDELDEYGVWVKSEPQDLSGVSGEGSDIVEPNLPDIEDLPDLDLDIGKEFDLSGPDTSIPVPESAATNEVPPVEKSDLSADLGVPVFEDFEVDSVAPSAPAAAAGKGESFTELSMDDFLDGADFAGEPAPAAPPVAEDAPLDIDLDFSDGLASPEESMPSVDDFDFEVIDETPAAAADTIAANISLETVSDFDDLLNGLDEGGDAKSSAPLMPEPEEAFEDIHLDISESEAVSGALDSVAESDDVSFDEPSIDIVPEPAADDLSFDDVSAFAADLSAPSDDFEADDVVAEMAAADSAQSIASPPPVPAAAQVAAAPVQAPATPSADASLSTQLLMRIAEELASIKTELSSLKGELSGLKSAETNEAEVQPPAEAAPRGFFDEEDDEKIALTGDELDNILNTADFTEESGADASADAVADSEILETAFPSADLLGAKPDLLDDFEAPAVEAEAAVAEEPASGFELDQADTLAELRENGVQPMTAPPDDTSYLEVEDITDMDLSEAVIEEPDLGDITLEEPTVEEPAIEAIHVDLDMEEVLHVEDVAAAGDADTEEINLSMEELNDSADSAVAEQSVEPLEPAIEEIVLDDEPALIDGNFAEVVPEDFVVEAAGNPEAESDVLEEVESFEDLEEPAPASAAPSGAMPASLQSEVKAVLSYMDQLLESLPEEKIEEFAKSEYFETYKRLFEELGLA
jgi:hypothetical protein